MDLDFDPATTKRSNWGGPLPNLPFLSIKAGMLVLVDPASVQHVLKTNFANYEKGAVFADAMGELLGNGIFTSDGTPWKTHRKIASNMFSRRLMRESCSMYVCVRMGGWVAGCARIGMAERSRSTHPHVPTNVPHTRAKPHEHPPT